MKGEIIDFRLRPPTEPYKGFFAKPIVYGANFTFRVDTPPSYQKSLEGEGGSSDQEALKLLYKEMDRAGIRIGVMNGRHTERGVKPCHVEDDYLAEISRDSKDSLVGLAGVNFDKPIDDIVGGIDKSVKELDMKGVCIEPGLAKTPMYAEDERLMPIYQKCDELKVPLLFMTGPFSGPDISYTDPVHFQRVSNNFPNLPIVLGHGCYPFVTQAIGVAFKSGFGAGVFVSPDVYVFAAGGEEYVKGINWIPYRFLFATSYPFGNCEQIVERTLNLSIEKDALPKYMYENAAKLLKL
jgi:predicted TIM-barrel fold metal-dependent hydrolase